jgi:hypothetical protein
METSNISGCEVAEELNILGKKVKNRRKENFRASKVILLIRF